MHDEPESDFHQLEIAPMLAIIERLQRDRSYRDTLASFSSKACGTS
jgi:hypothetical protein